MSRKIASQAILETNIFKELTSISSRAGFDNHFYDQQLMADERTFIMDYTNMVKTCDEAIVEGLLAKEPVQILERKMVKKGNQAFTRVLV